MTAYHIELFAVLAMLGLSYSVLVRHLERLRRGLTRGHVANSMDVWIMAGALLLPISLLTALVLLTYAAEWPSRRIVDGGRPRRYVISVGVNLVAALTGAQVHAFLAEPVSLLAVILAWSAVNDILIAAVMVVGGSRTGIRRLLSPRNHAFDVATKLAGVILAMLLAWEPALGVAVFPFLLAGHRLALRNSIEETAAFDLDTGLWSEDGWRIQGALVLVEAPASVLLILIDPALANREVKISAALGGLFSQPDLLGRADRVRPVRHVIGRYGTRQVAILSEVDVDGAGVLLARHVRDRLRMAGIDCLVGASVGSGFDLDDLLMQAGGDLMRRRAEAGVSVRW